MEPCPSEVGSVYAERDAEGAQTLVLVEPLEQYAAKLLRKEVSRLRLKVVRKGPDMNDHKNGYMALLREHMGTTASSGDVGVRGTKCTLNEFNGGVDAHREMELVLPTVNPVARPKRFEELLRAADQPACMFTSRPPIVSQPPPTINMKNLMDVIFFSEELRQNDGDASESAIGLDPQYTERARTFWSQVAVLLLPLPERLAATPVVSLESATIAFTAWRQLCVRYEIALAAHGMDEASSSSWANETEELQHLRDLVLKHPDMRDVVKVHRTPAQHDTTQASQHEQDHEHTSPESSAAESELVSQSQDVVTAMEMQDVAVVTDDDASCRDQDEDGDEQDGVEEEHEQPLQQTPVPVATTEVELLQRQYWENKNKLVLQQIANAKVHNKIEQFKLYEERFRVSKRKIQELTRELQHSDADAGPNRSAETNAELQYYVHERKKALGALLRQSREN